MAILSLAWTEHPPAEYTGGALTIGNFDGVHLGHRELVTRARDRAKQVNGPAVVLTFDPPPAAILAPRPEKSVPLTTLAQRSELLLHAGADHVVVLKTDAGLLSLSPEAFFEDVIVGLFQSKAVVEGDNFRFGRARAGTTSTLRTLCIGRGIAFEEVEALRLADEVISSSRIRSALVSGNVSDASACLGRRYAIQGRVVEGAKRGRTIGFPTANLAGIPTVIPRDGVYACRVQVGNQTYAAAMNIGENPTFHERNRKVEVHLIHFVGELYGQTLQVEFVDRIRDTRSFPSVAELKDQLSRDIGKSEQLCRLS